MLHRSEDRATPRARGQLGLWVGSWTSPGGFGTGNPAGRRATPPLPGQLLTASRLSLCGRPRGRSPGQRGDARGVLSGLCR